MDPDHVVPSPGSLLSRLDCADWRYLADAGVRRSLSAGELLFRRGDFAGQVVLITRGWVKVTIAAANGYEVLLALRGPGDVVGELAVLDGQSRSASVRTLGETSVTVLPAARFLDALRERPGIAISLLAHLAHRLRGSDNRRLEQAAHNSTERLAAFLLRLAEQHGVGVAGSGGIRISVRLSQHELAGAIGSSREAVARVLRVFRERGVVSTERRNLVISAPQVLRAIAADVQFDTEESC
jgi:CRP/FNR family transcriptional regulator, cyclic AMP receptor protein